MLSRFFIDRPIFSTVLSIVITLAGAVSVTSLPVAQYPNITPPTVQLAVNYPGASAQVVADTIAAPIEQQVNGVENMLYMSSQSNNDGSYNLTVTFDLGTDLNTALVMVQNRVALAIPQLPVEVQRQGLTIKKKAGNILLVINFISPSGKYDDLYLSNYATLYVRDELFRVDGVSDITYLGQRDYSIRAWLDPDQFAARGLSGGDVALAIQQQSLALAAGQLAQQPSRGRRAFQPPLAALGRLETPEQFGEVIVKVNPPSTSSGQAIPNAAAGIVRLRDVARVELGAQNYNQSCALNGYPSVGLAVFQLPGSNALDVAGRVRARMDELKKSFPEGIDYRIAHDTTPFVQESIDDVLHTLLEAIGLVALVVLVFLQNWRASLIPLLAVPVAIIGSFAVMLVLGFGFNNISLFGFVLAIGIVVDDAIVVVENVERWLEQGLPARQAAYKAMEEVTSPVIAVALVLCAVFVPCAFISGITGQFFRQFAVTIASSTVISAINSLTLSPALAAILLKPHTDRRDPLDRVLKFALGWFFALFNRGLSATTHLYSRVVHRMVRFSSAVLVVYAGLLLLTWWGMNSVPLGFIPQQDQGWFLINVQLPDSASLERTQRVMAKTEKMCLATPGVLDVVRVAGMSFLLGANSSNYGSMFVHLAPFEDRRSPDLGAEAIMARLRRAYAVQVPEAQISLFSAPPVPGIGVAGGFKLMVEDRAGVGLSSLEQATNKLVGALARSPGIVGVFSLFRAKTPQLYMDIDRTKVKSMGVSLTDLNQTLETYLGSVYVNSFNAFGRFWQVNIMAEGRFRDHVSIVNQLKVRNNQGKMAPLGALVELREITGPVNVTRYNLYAAAPVTGNVLSSISTGEAIDQIQNLAGHTLPRTTSTEWTELMFMQIRAGNTAMYVFALSVVFVFLALAALYESWSLPLAVILVVPMCLLSSVTGIALSHMTINIFVQIGFVVLVGLACKNAILIVEFARDLHAAGKPLAEAAAEASGLRLRPIMMTSFAFILGVIPLVVAQGAGAEMRRSLGMAVFAGMLGVTIFGIFLTPVFFYVVESIGKMRWLASRPMRWIGSLAAGAAVGALGGWLVGELGFAHARAALVVGAILGLLVAFVVVRLSRLRPRRTAP